jgi:hypothetical protein
VPAVDKKLQRVVEGMETVMRIDVLLTLEELFLFGLFFRSVYICCASIYDVLLLGSANEIVIPVCFCLCFLQ